MPHVQSKISQSLSNSTTIVDSLPGNITLGNYVFCFITTDSTSLAGLQNVTISDNLGHIWIRLYCERDGGGTGQGFVCWYAKVASPGALTVTVTLDALRGFRGMILAEYSADATGAVNKSNGNTDGDVGAAGPNGIFLANVSPDISGCTIVAFMGVVSPLTGTKTLTAGTLNGAFTMRQFSNEVIPLGFEDFVFNSTGLMEPTATYSEAGANRYMTFTVALKPTGGGPPPQGSHKNMLLLGVG